MSMRKLFTTVATVAALVVSAPAFASDDDTKLEHRQWSWQGVFGTYDDAQLRRGFQVYREICAGCHSLNLIRFRNLLDIGISEEEAKAMATQIELQDGFDDSGEPKFRPGTLADTLPAPFPNEKAARASNNGSLPPDLSLMNKARKNGPDYLYTLLTSYEDGAPDGIDLMDDMYYNRAFPGHQIAMPPMIFDESVEFEDGSDNSKEAIAADVVAFLNWTAEPKLEERKSMGMKVMILLAVMTALFYALKRQIWSRVDH